jgi:SAM-dependent methyltransferase
MGGYVHGYGGGEVRRLDDQARALEELLHGGLVLAPGTRVLEAGCGTGAQTEALLRHSPGAVLTSIDVSDASLAVARARIGDDARVSFVRADIAALPFPPGQFDHVFVCFVLEHLPDPEAALAALGRMLRPGGGITVIEGDHGSVFFHPDDAAARAAIAAQVALQARAGGDALIGRRLFTLLRAAGFATISVSPRTVLADGAAPALAEAFTRRTFTAMVAAVGEQAVAEGLASRDDFAAGIAALGRTAGDAGALCYTFFRAAATWPG